MALAADLIGFVESDERSVGQSEPVPVVRVVAIEAPSSGHVLEFDLEVELLHFSRSPVDRHSLMTLRAGKDAFSERRGRYRELLLFLLWQEGRPLCRLSCRPCRGDLEYERQKTD